MTTTVYVAGNYTVHAGYKAGTYPSGNPRYRTLCGRPNRRDRYEPTPTGPGLEVTCKRCLAKM